MTFIDLIYSLPGLIKWFIIILLAVWIFEIFLFPFKFNILNNKITKLFDLQKQTLDEIKKENERTDVLLATIMSSILRCEQNDERNTKNKDVK